WADILFSHEPTKTAMGGYQIVEQPRQLRTDYFIFSWAYQSASWRKLRMDKQSIAWFKIVKEEPDISKLYDISYSFDLSFSLFFVQETANIKIVR
ncbi:MAG: hypothetical protein WDZ90_01000, partial [Candidatus Paceibacterota bacterium]